MLRELNSHTRGNEGDGQVTDKTMPHGFHPIVLGSSPGTDNSRLRGSGRLANTLSSSFFTSTVDIISELASVDSGDR